MKRVLTTKMTLWLALATATVVLMAASSPQCARSADTVSGPALQTSAANTCVQDCQATFKAAKKEEQARYKAAKAACNGDAECRAEEAAIHDYINDELVADKDACIDNCNHQQGAATGGQ
jgi:hypothetical protein